jgi:hypothetical protein
MIVGDGARFDYLVDVLVNLDLNVVEFLHRFQYGLYAIIVTRYCLLKFVLLDLFYREKVPQHTFNAAAEECGVDDCEGELETIQKPQSMTMIMNAT